MIVVSVAELPVIEVLFVEEFHVQVPGVVVEVTVKSVRPLTAVPEAEPAPPMLQTVEPLCWLTVTVLESVRTRFPLASWMSTRSRDTLTPSAPMVPGLKLVAVLAAAPIAVIETV